MARGNEEERWQREMEIKKTREEGGRCDARR